jgi:hypothetical protein
MFNINEVKPQSTNNRPDPGHLPTGTYIARIVQVIGLGVQERQPYKGEPKTPAPFIRITFELPYETIEITDKDGVVTNQPRWLSKEMVFSGADMSTCVKWMKKLDPTNELGGDWAKAIGKEVQVYVTATQGKKDPKKYYNDVKDVLAVPKGMTIPDIYAPEKKMVFSTRHVDENTVNNFNNMPKWLQEKITKALDFPNSALDKALNGGQTPQPTPQPEPESDTDYDPWV